MPRSRSHTPTSEDDNQPKEVSSHKQNRHLNMIQRSYLLAAIFEARGRLDVTEPRINKLTSKLYEEILTALSRYSDIHGLKDDNLPSKVTVRLFLRNFERTGSIEPRKPTGRKSKIPDNIRERLCELALLNHTFSEVQSIVQNETGVFLNRTTASRIMREMVQTKKRVKRSENATK